MSALWRAAPRRARLWGVRLTNARFTVTAGAVARDRRGRVLLFNHVFRKGSGWGIPGGFIKKGEQPEEAVRREVREESGLELSEVELAFVRAHRRPAQVEIIFRCLVEDGPAPSLSGEIHSAEWFDLDSLPPGLTRDQRQLIERALKGATPGRD
ncbi:MAG TPA: NUDIX domain-containing protein [Pyrinomonadaceae bacterium]|nr:NUDIX domain-containing protein [Pyrinomonadaceae bacterium]